MERPTVLGPHPTMMVSCERASASVLDVRVALWACFALVVVGHIHFSEVLMLMTLPDSRERMAWQTAA